ncbi:MAG: hypothetical protein IPI30_22675 [Saprospiraceae bacterium]|nr:hypothetical protein [Candidatus Vicinibacter affinis]
MKYTLSILLFFVYFSNFISAQNVDDYLDNYLGKNKGGYVQPVSDILTGIFNTGLVTDPKIGDRFNIKFSLVGSAGLVTDNLKNFLCTTDDPFSPEQTVKLQQL